MVNLVLILFTCWRLADARADGVLLNWASSTKLRTALCSYWTCLDWKRSILVLVFVLVLGLVLVVLHCFICNAASHLTPVVSGWCASQLAAPGWRFPFCGLHSCYFENSESLLRSCAMLTYQVPSPFLLPIHCNRLITVCPLWLRQAIIDGETIATNAVH